MPLDDSPAAHVSSHVFQDSPLCSSLSHPSHDRPLIQKRIETATTAVSAKRNSVGFVDDCRMELDGARFRLGDMVWAKVKSHPWWPGQIFDPALASSLARKSRRESHLLVAFFGDSTFGWFPESELIPFESNFTQKSKQTSAPNFVEAVEDALEEIGRRVELGLICPCNVSIEMEARRQKGRGINLDRQLREARKGFKPSKMVAFVKDVACSPFAPSRDMLWRAKAEAQAHAFRVTAFHARDSEYEECLGKFFKGEDPTPNSRERMQGLDDRSVTMAGQTAFPEEDKLEETNFQVSVDMACEEKVAPDDLQRKDRAVGSDKFSAKMKANATSSIPSGTGKHKRSRKEGKPPELLESPSPEIEVRKGTKGTNSHWKDAIPHKGETDGENGGLESNKTCLSYSQDIRNDAPVSDMNDDEGPKSQATPKGFKRLVKGAKSVRAELKESSNVNISVEDESNGIGKLKPDEMGMDSNKRKRERKSMLQSERGFDSARPSKLKIRPSMTPGRLVSEPCMTAAQDILEDEKNLVGDCEEQQIAVAISPSTQEAEASCPVASERNTDAGLMLEEKNLLEKLEGNNFVGNLQASSEIQDERGKDLQSKKEYAEFSVLQVSQKQQSGNMETVHVSIGEACKLDRSRLPHGEHGENLVVSGDKGESVEISGQSSKGCCASSNVVVKDMKLEKVLHEVKISKYCGSKDGNLSRRRGILDLDCSQKTAEAKRKRLKTISSGKALENPTPGVKGAPHVNESVSLGSPEKSPSRSVDLVSVQEDDVFEEQKPEIILEVKELLEYLMSLATNPLGERKEQFSAVQKALTKFRKSVFQSDNCSHHIHSHQGQNDVSAPSAANTMRVCQEGEQLTGAPENCVDDLNATNTIEQVVAITETSGQLSEAKTSKADSVKPETNGSQKVKLQCSKQAKTAIVGQCSQTEPSKANNFRPEITGGQVVKSECQRGTSDHSFNGPVKNSKKPALISVSTRVAASSSRPVLETDIPAHGLRDASKSFGSVNQHLSNVGCETDRPFPQLKVNKANQAQGTALLMRFPQGFALPSEAQLRATFIHFGQLDLSRTRVYCNSGCAQVVYQHAHDAEAALKYVKENNVFGQAPVSFKLKHFSQMREVGVTQISLSKESKTLKSEERLSIAAVDREDINVVHDRGTFMSSRNNTLYDNQLQIQSSSLPIKAGLKKTDESMFSTAKNGTRMTFQLSCGVNLQSMPIINTSRNTMALDQVAVKSSCEKLSSIPKDPHSHIDSSKSVHSVCSGSETSLGLPIPTDISHQMLTLLHQVSALVGSSGIVL